MLVSRENEGAMGARGKLEATETAEEGERANLLMRFEPLCSGSCPLASAFLGLIMTSLVSSNTTR